MPLSPARQKRPSWTLREKRKIILFTDNHTLREAADKFGCSISIVSRRRGNGRTYLKGKTPRSVDLPNALNLRRNQIPKPVSRQVANISMKPPHHNPGCDAHRRIRRRVGGKCRSCGVPLMAAAAGDFGCVNANCRWSLSAIMDRLDRDLEVAVSAYEADRARSSSSSSSMLLIGVLILAFLLSYTAFVL